MILLIMGGGKFGIKAIEYAKEKNQSAIVIDKDSLCQAIEFTDKQFKNLNDFKNSLENFNKNEIWFMEGEVNIINDLFALIDIEHVIPVIPIHLMALIITTFFQKHLIHLIPDRESIKHFIDTSKKDLIISSNIEKGIAYLSHAKIDETCPDNCIGPPNFCPHFKREKEITITQFLREHFNIDNYIDIIKLEDTIKIIIIIESYQLKPGLGGLLGHEINDIIKMLKENLLAISKKRCKIIIATTCNCHGVINFFKSGN